MILSTFCNEKMALGNIIAVTLSYFIQASLSMCEETMQAEYILLKSNDY